MESKNLRLNVSSSDIKPMKTDLSSLPGTKLQNRIGKKRENVSQLAKSSSAGMSSVSVPAGTKNQKPWLPRQKRPDKRQSRTSGVVGLGTNRKNYHQMNDDSIEPDFDIEFEKGKKQNLAHLLNMKFQLAPRDTSVSNYWRATHSGNTGKGKRLNNYSCRSHLNKDHYLQANCQFVLKADGDYTVYLADPDLLVPWDSIEQIRIWGSEVGSCPICLHPPVAAKITRCGHIYCWPCILHFLALSDKPSRPCPICDVSIRIPDLKSVVALEQRNLKVGDMLEMRLMKRDRHSLQPQPVSRSKEFQIPSKQQKPSYLGEVDDDHVFSKLLLCTPNEVVGLILQWEKSELLTQLESEKDCPESCFIQQALELLALRESNTIVECLSSFATALDLTAGNNVDSCKSDSSLSGVLNQDKNIKTGKEANEELTFGELKSESESCVLPNALNVDIPLTESSAFRRSPVVSPDNVSMADTHHNQQQKNVFYFYQSSDGQAIYLHHINVQMLVRCYGTLELCPEIIQGHIVEIETLSMTEDWRNRLRYLGHIPVSKQFQIMEIALTEPEMNSNILEEFKERVDERARRRRRKDREERRRELEIQRAEDAKWGRTKNQPIVRLDSQVHFPGFSPSSQNLPKIGEDTFGGLSPSNIEHEAQHGAGLSFAQMLREGKNKVPTVFSALSKSEMNISESAFSLNKPGRYFNSDSESEIANYAPAPEYKDTFSSALAAAFDQAAKLKVVSIADENPENLSNKKSKKKVKQKVLFSTGMNFM